MSQWTPKEYKPGWNQSTKWTSRDGKLVKLESLELDVQDNQIGDEGARCLGKGLRELTGLTSLRVFLLKNMIGVGELQKLCNLEGRVKSRKRPLPS